MNHVPYTSGHYSRLQPCKTNLRTSNESILQYIFCRQRCSCWPSFMVFSVVPGIKMSNATLEVLSQCEIISSPFKTCLKMMEQKKTVGVSSFSLLFLMSIWGFYYATYSNIPIGQYSTWFFSCYDPRSAMEYWIGLLCAAFAAIAFGVEYAPVPC